MSLSLPGRISSLLISGAFWRQHSAPLAKFRLCDLMFPKQIHKEILYNISFITLSFFYITATPGLCDVGVGPGALCMLRQAPYWLSYIPKPANSFNRMKKEFHFATAFWRLCLLCSSNLSRELRLTLPLHIKSSLINLTCWNILLAGSSWFWWLNNSTGHTPTFYD